MKLKFLRSKHAIHSSSPAILMFEISPEYRDNEITFYSEYACSELHSKFPLRARFPEEYFNTLSSEYQHADILAKHFMCSRFTNVSQ